MSIAPHPPLEPPASRIVLMAIGWIELGNPAQALVELEDLPAEVRQHPDVLEVRWQICAATGDWAAALPWARALMDAAPDRASGWLHHAYALRRAPGGGLAAAHAALRAAWERFRQEPLIPYNLACYACQLGRLDEARDWLRRAMAIGGRDPVRRLALADEDLRLLWDELRGTREWQGG